MGGSWSNESVFGSEYVGGACTIMGNITLASGITLTIEPDAALLVGSSQEASPSAINGSFTINDNASINNYGTVDSNGTGDVITNEGAINNHGTFNNYGVINNYGGTITNAGSFDNAGAIDNYAGCTMAQDVGCTASGDDLNATIINEPGGIITNNHVIFNSAGIANYGLIASNVNNCLKCILIFGPNSAFLINSGTLTEYCGSVTTGKLSGSFPVIACPLVTQATSTTFMTDGGASLNQTSATGVSVTISGSSASNGTSVTISAEDLSSTEQDVAASGLGSPQYYDVSVFGITDGTALVCLPNTQPPSSLTIQYWDGSVWVPASGITSSGSTAICGDIPVPALTGTNVASGVTGATTASNATSTATQTTSKTITTTVTQTATMTTTTTTTLPASTSTTTTVSTVSTTITTTASATTTSFVAETSSVVPTWAYGVMAVLLVVGLTIGYVVRGSPRTRP